jgi:hypothetical protein
MTAHRTGPECTQNAFDFEIEQRKVSLRRNDRNCSIGFGQVGLIVALLQAGVPAMERFMSSHIRPRTAMESRIGSRYRYGRLTGRGRPLGATTSRCVLLDVRYLSVVGAQTALDSEKDRRAAAALDHWRSFQDALANTKRRYPRQAFLSFAEAVRC